MLQVFFGLIRGYYPHVSYRARHRRLGHAVKLAAWCMADNYPSWRMFSFYSDR